MENIKQTNSEADITSANVEKETTQTPEQIKQAEIANKFAKYSGMTKEQLQTNASFIKDAVEAFNEALSNLPTKKYLVQKYVGGPSNDIYESFVNAVFSGYEWVEAGQGVEYWLTQGLTVSELDKNAFIPDSRNDPENYTYFDNITIPATINQVKFSSSPWMYIDYFLSGKVDEYVNSVLAEGSKALKLSQIYDAIKTLKEIFSATYAKASTTPEAETNHLAGTANNLIEGFAEMRNFFFNMYNHNNVFAISSDFTGYNNMTKGDEMYIVDNETYSALQKVSATFLAKENLLDFGNASKWVIVPKSIRNPNTGKLEKIDFFTDSTGNRVKGAIMVVQKSALRRLMNLENGFAEFYPNNLTNEHWFNARWKTGYLKWGQVAIYNNANLEAPFEVPVATKTA